VRIIDQPYLTGWMNNELYLMAHLPLVEDRPKYANYKDDTQHLLEHIDLFRLHDLSLQRRVALEAIRDHTGIPTQITE